jgi:tetratricopeptide (TPR) repeat protein
MLLWIYTMDEYFNAERVVEMFEVLRERHPDLTIPFEKILAVGKAYRVMGEHERAWLVFRATVDSSFINDASLSATLEDQGQFLGSLEYMDRIWRDYPDTSAVVSAYFAISQQLYEKAPKAHELKAEENRRRRQRGDKAKDEEGYDRIGLLKRSLEYLHGFLTLYPDEPLADDAAFSMANAFFALEDYKTVVVVAERFQKRYPKSTFVSSFQYMAALGHFWQLHYDEALASAAPVSDGDSKDRDYARYITAQIHHAQGAPGEAIAWYRKVEKLYPDAKEAIGSRDNQFKSGDTDLRGIFVAEDLNGSATVIARQEGRYEFYRGTSHLGRPVLPNAKQSQQKKPSRTLQQKDFLQNINYSNGMIQSQNIKGWDSFRRQKGGKGVEVKKAY